MNALATASALFAHPLPWVVLGGVFVGAAASEATKRTADRKDPDRARTRKWTLACLSLSVAVVLGLLAVFVPAPAKIMDARLAWAAGISAAAACAALRFKKALGIPIVMILLAVVIVFGLFLQGIRAFTGETEIAAVRVISAANASMRLELVPRGEDPVLLTMQGQYFAPTVKVVIFNDLFVFLGARTWYRFEGMTSFDQNLRPQNTSFHVARAHGIAEKLWTLFEAYETLIPGVKTAKVEIVMQKAKEFATYGVRVLNDGRVRIVPVSG